MSEREEAHLREASDLGGVRRGRVQRLPRAFPLLCDKARLVHQQVCPVGSLDDQGDGAVSPVSTTSRPGRGSPSTSAGVTTRPESTVTSSPA